MTPRSRLRAALPAVVLGWGIGAVLAAPVAWSGARDLGAVVAHRPRGLASLGAPGGGVALAAGRAGLEQGGPTLLWTLGGAVVAMVLLSPWLGMTWLAALEAPRSLGSAALRGLRAYLPAILVSVAVGLVGLIGLALAGLLPLGVHWALGDHPNVALHDLATLGATAPALVLAAVLATWHDLARAALIAGGGNRVRPALRQGLRRLGTGRVVSYTGHRLLGLALAFAALQVATLPTVGLTGVAFVVLLGQTAALGRTLVRARWLARCLV